MTMAETMIERAAQRRRWLNAIAEMIDSDGAPADKPIAWQFARAADAVGGDDYNAKLGHAIELLNIRLRAWDSSSVGAS